MFGSSEPRSKRGLAFLAAAGAALAWPAESEALPKPGTPSADARVEDPDGKTMTIKALRGRPVIVVYEDKDSKQANQALKGDLTRILKDKALKSAVVLAPVADVSEYNSWPAKGFVKDAIRDEAKKTGTTIWCDWDASFRRAFDLAPKASNVIVIGRGGAVRFAASGTLSASQRAEIEAILREETAKPAP
jgi:predicted transcriptional regulator